MHKDSSLVFTCGLVLLFIISAGCTGTGAAPKSTYTVSSDGVLSLSYAPVTISEQIIVANETYTKSRIVMHTQDGDVFMYLAAPKNPKAAIVYAPGAGEKLAGHEERMIRFATAGYVFLFVDTRGNGGETHGSPLDPQGDYNRFSKGEWPQFYETIGDLSAARKILADKFSVPVYAVGSSNGGRYAAIAAGTDPAFAGYVGVSTSDWGILSSVISQGYGGDLIRFATSLEPSTYIGKISPRPVWMFHARADPIIPFEQGKSLFDKAGEPKTFTEFTGGHGIDPGVDTQIIGQWAQIYDNRK